MPRFKLVIEYDGTRYSGWQIQPTARTVQGMLVTAARKGFDGVGESMGSGRTDSGVHALGQVAHLDIDTRVSAAQELAVINENLPHDINVRAATLADRRFHARHDATGRSYLYQISRRRSAFGKSYIWWVREPLDVGAMRRASLSMVGMHDYSAFTEAAKGESMKVLMTALEVVEAGDLLLIRLRASHFLRKMARRVVGTLVATGKGEIPVDAISEALEAPHRSELQITAPPSGLFLEEVIYKGEAFSRELRPALVIGA
jgi:tRNA pseudouridine38-40 synthase